MKNLFLRGFRVPSLCGENSEALEWRRGLPRPSRKASQSCTCLHQTRKLFQSGTLWFLTLSLSHDLGNTRESSGALEEDAMHCGHSEILSWVEGKGQEKSSTIWLKSSSSDDVKYTLYFLTRLKQRKLLKVLMPKSVLPILFPKSCVFLLGTVDSTRSSWLRRILLTHTKRAWSSRKGLAWGHLCADKTLCEKQYPELMQEWRLFP